MASKQGANGGAGSSQGNATASSLEPCEYFCGSCGALVRLKPSDAVRCHSCAYRILYKARIKKELQYEAR